MAEIVGLLLAAKAKTLFVVAGLGFLAIAVVGDVAGRIRPGRIGRLGAALLGVALLGGGALFHVKGGSDPGRTERQVGVEGNRNREPAAPSGSAAPAGPPHESPSAPR